MNNVALEQQVFDWTECEDAEVGDMIFYDITLKVALGEFPVGTKFISAFWMSTQGVVSVLDEDEEEHIFRISVSVGEKVDNEEFYAGMEDDIPIDLELN
jgi:hypothetical protein